MKLKNSAFIVLMSISSYALANEQTECPCPQKLVRLAIDIDPVQNPEYDIFDSMADDMIARGVEVEKPKPLSKAELWARIIGCYMLNKYIAARSFMNHYWSVLSKRFSTVKS